MNKYKNWYNNLIVKSKNRDIDEYTELHHIIPKSLGGSDDKDNLVELTAREHFIAHLLLTKITEGQNKQKMFTAAFNMVNMNNIKVNSRIYKMLKENHSDYMKKNNPVFDNNVKNKISSTLKEYYKSNKNAMLGKNHSPESIKKMSLAKKGKTPWNKGSKTGQVPSTKINGHSEESKKKISNATSIAMKEYWRKKREVDNNISFNS